MKAKQMTLTDMEQEEPVSTSKKIKTLKGEKEDFEFYPTTEELMQAMKNNIWEYLRSHKNDYAQRDNKRDSVSIDIYSDDDSLKEKLDIYSFLDIGAGDGRVLDFFEARRKYAVEIARSQADDLIRRDIFLIGRNFWDVTFIDQYYSLIYCNPPFSSFDEWAVKILKECNFNILYLVMPVRWQNKQEIMQELKRYEFAIVGEYDFSQAERQARGKVNLVRVNAKWEKTKWGTKKEVYQQTVTDTFETWIKDYIADFEEKPAVDWEEKREQDIALKNTPIEQLVLDYEREKQSLADAFKAIGKLDTQIIKLMGQDKKSMLEIIKKSIGALKKKYWRIAFDKLDPVRTRLTHETKKTMFSQIEEFRTLDFNVDNIYSIIIWVINNSNNGILRQIGDIFDKMSSPQYITKYKSNRHWTKSSWRYMQDDYYYKKFPERWKLGLDYRIVVQAYSYNLYSDRDSYTIVDDFIVICNNLGFPIKDCCKPKYWQHGGQQDFYTTGGELAFSMRYYTGNKNAHLKINKRLLMKFNIEVAKIRKWMSEPSDVAEEYDVSEEEAAAMWNNGLVLLGSSDIKMLEFKEG